MGVSRLQNVIRDTFQVQANSTRVRNIFTITDYLSASLDINITQVTVNTAKLYRKLKLEVRAVDGDTRESVYGRLGDISNLQVNTNLSGSTVELEIVNNNSFIVQVSLTRTKLR